MSIRSISFLKEEFSKYIKKQISRAQWEIRNTGGLPDHYKQYLENGLENIMELVIDGEYHYAEFLLAILRARIETASDLSEETKEKLLAVIPVVRPVKNNCDFPNAMKRVMETLVLNGKAEIVYQYKAIS